MKKKMSFLNDDFIYKSKNEAIQPLCAKQIAPRC